MKKINVERDVELLPQTKAKYFPFTHAVSSWWEAACNVAKSCGVNTMLSGHYAAVFDESFVNADSILVQKEILDLKRVKEIVKSSKELKSNGVLSNVVLIEEWLRGTLK